MSVSRFRVGRAGTLTKRETALSLMRIAGYENDIRKWTRLYIENAVSLRAANEAWRLGRERAKSEGKS